MNLTPEEIQARLAAQPDLPTEGQYPTDFFDGPPRQAAVLLPLIQIASEWHLLYIRRTVVTGDTHSGQVAFPGGAREQQDASLIDTALREAAEEIGIQPTDVKILGQLHNFLTISNFLVTPFIGLLPWPYPLTPSPREVDRWFSIPLAWLADAANRYEVQRDWENDSSSFSVIFYNEYDRETLWGASARFTLALLEALRVANS